jgi:hypothetical protein
MLGSPAPSPAARTALNYPLCTCGKQPRLTSLKPNSSHPYRLPLADFQCECGTMTTMPWRPSGQRFAVMAGEHDDQRRDYLVVTQQYGQTGRLWRWEIRRRSKPLGIKFYDDDFKSEHMAKLAGEQALVVFLDGLCRELQAGREGEAGRGRSDDREPDRHATVAGRSPTSGTRA